MVGQSPERSGMFDTAARLRAMARAGVGTPKVAPSWIRELEEGLGGVYLFSGPPSEDLLSVARHIAKLSICLGTADASCTCRHCVTGLEGCRDVRVVLPNQHGNLLSEHFEGLDRFFALPPATGALRKVLIAKGVEKASPSSISSLLKVLEGGVNPPDVALFVSHRPQDIAPALLSRMLEVRFGVDGSPSADRFGDSQAGRDLSRVASSLPGPSQPYLQARKALPSVWAGIQAGDSNRAWRALRNCLDGQEGVRATAEVLHQSVADMLVLCSRNSQATMPPLGVMHSMREDMEAHAMVWGEAPLASLADDLRQMLRAVPGRDLRPTLYRWVLKASGLASDKAFARPETTTTSLKRAGQEESASILSDDDIVIDFGDHLRGGT